MADDLDPLVYALAGGQRWLTPQQLEQLQRAQDYAPKNPTIEFGTHQPPVAPTNLGDYPGVRDTAKHVGEGLAELPLAAGRLVTGSSDTPHEDLATTILGAYGPPLAKGMAAGLVPMAARGAGKAAGELAPPYYSAAAKAIRGSDVARAVPEQLYPTEGWLSKLGVGNRGVRDELAWAGKSEPPGPYATPRQMEEWAQGAMPEVTPVVHSNDPGPFYTIRRNARGDWDAITPQGNRGGTFRGDLSQAEAVQEARRSLTFPSKVKYGPDTHPTMSLPGGENYREVLLTMPRELGQTKDSHWEEPGVFAWLRRTDRMVPDEAGTPRKTLFMEEVQRRKKWDNSKLDANSLALKTAIRQAAEEGHEQVAWTTGDIQAERANLSRLIKDLHWTRYKDGSYGLSGETTRGGQHQFGSSIPEAKLADHVGKDVAQKIVDQANAQDQSSQFVTGVLKNSDLKVGGEGMRSFYDKELVNKANALGKKYGAKVEQRDFSHREFDRSTGNMRPENKTQKVHVLKLTPQLKEAALKQGFPLFAAGGATYLAGQDDGNDELMRALGGRPR